MSNTYSMADIDSELENEYGPLVFKVGQKEYSLQKLVRIPATRRNAVAEKLKMFQAEDPEGFDEADIVEAMEFILENITDKDKGPELVAAFKGDVLKLQILFKRWVEHTQPGEA